MAVPIVLPITEFTKSAIETSPSGAVALIDKDGHALGVLKNPEVYLVEGFIDEGVNRILRRKSEGKFEVRLACVTTLPTLNVPILNVN